MRIQKFPYLKHYSHPPAEYLQPRQDMARCWRKFLMVAIDKSPGRALAFWLFQNTANSLMQLPTPDQIGTAYNYNISDEPILHEYWPFTFDEIYRIVIYKELITLPESNIYHYDIERLYRIITDECNDCFDVWLEPDFISVTIK